MLRSVSQVIFDNPQTASAIRAPSPIVKIREASSTWLMNIKKVDSRLGRSEVPIEICGQPNEMVLHVKMLDPSNPLEQEAIGILGVNPI